MSLVAVVGGTGFLGSAIVRRLYERGIPVRTVSRRPIPGTPWPHEAADISDKASLLRALRSASAVIHVAALAHINSGRVTRELYYRINVQGTRNVVEAARALGVRQIVFASSIAVYGTNREGVLRETTVCSPDSDYGWSKLLAEDVLVTECEGVETVSLRFSPLYGPGDPGNVGRLAKLLRSNRFLWIGRGTNRKCLLYVDDAAEACVVALSLPAPGRNRVFNVGGEPQTMREIVHLIARVVGRSPPKIHLPQPVVTAPVKVLSRFAPKSQHLGAVRWALSKWLSDDVVDSTMFQRASGWQPAIPLDQGIPAALRT